MGIPAGTAYTESDFCNYINAKIDCLLGRATDTGRLGEQIHQSLLGYSTAMTTQAIAETLCIINTDIKYYMAQQFSQVQQPVEFNSEEYENKSNNPVTAQAKFTVNKKPRVLFPTTPSYHQTLQIGNTMNSWKSTPLESTQLIDQLGRRVDRVATIQIITADGNTKTPIGEIDNFSFEINGIQIPTKVLVMEATQYQALIRNDWLSKANATLN
ncbi:hypothetical protein G9A89_005852 [Geosiphon pyriformis]|nr:hypothetical protein G9A89_005852 [Geosiphon pyriformis]